MPAFTQGKWKVNAHAPKGFTHADMDNIISADGKYIASVQKKADARLIAAAPDMYEALKECYDFIEAIICYDCEYCSRSLDADGLRIALDDLFARIDGEVILP